jgi:hypothetical protein
MAKTWRGRGTGEPSNACSKAPGGRCVAHRSGDVTETSVELLDIGAQLAFGSVLDIDDLVASYNDGAPLLIREFHRPLLN